MARKKREEEKDLLVEEVSFEIMEEKPILRRARVSMILRRSGEILLELEDGTGERIDFDSVLHADLKEGDYVEVI